MDATTSMTGGVTWAQLTMVGTVAASHMTMPNHWLPYSIVGRAHAWTLRKTLMLSKLHTVKISRRSCGKQKPVVLFWGCDATHVVMNENARSTNELTQNKTYCFIQ